MGRNVYGELGNIYAVARVRYEARVEERQQRKRSLSEPLLVSGLGQLSHAKLHKPPTQQKLYERPRNRLQKRATAPALQHQRNSARLFILEFEPYPPGARPSEFLGVYSSIDSVTAAAFRHGACSFSREGLLDGSEYLSPTGRIRIIPTTIVSMGTRVAVPARTPSTKGEPVRLDIPHPKEQEVGEEEKPNVFLAVHRGPHIAVCLGAFSDKSLAWGACLKEKTACAMMGSLVDEIREIGDKNMPQLSARIVGSGRHVFSVQGHAVDSRNK